MVNDMELYLMSFLEGYLGPEKAYRLRNMAYKWRFKDAWRYGMMHRNAKKELEDGFTRAEVEAMDAAWELTVDAMTARIKEPEDVNHGLNLALDKRERTIKKNGELIQDNQRLQAEVVRLKEKEGCVPAQLIDQAIVIVELRSRIAELEKSLKCECHKNELAKKYIETLIHPV